MKGVGDLKWLQYMSEDQKQYLKKNEIIQNDEEYIAWKKLMMLSLNNSKALLTHHNRVRILKNGIETFPAIFEAIASAKKYIHLEYYVFESCELTDKLISLLLEKVKAGIQVRLIYDDVGSWKLSNDDIKRMEEGGIQIYPFLPVRVHRFKLNYRNHRKIIVIDGFTAFVGGLNFAERYMDGLPEIGIWRDTHLMVQGEAATSLQIVFLTDWYFVRQELLLNKAEYLPSIPAEGKTLMQTVASGPDSDWASIQQTYFTMINLAKKYVFISTPYFMPCETTLNCIKAAAMSGVDVRLLLPERSDSWLTTWCSRSYAEQLLEAGVRIFWYEKGLNHSKVIVVDGHVASVGTANMDVRSFEQNFEVNVIIYNRETAKELAVDFVNDLRNSKEVQYKNWRFRPKKSKVRESLARLFAPLL